jgi:poly(A) polymerase
MKSIAIKILQTLRENGFTALFAGGCVRDMVMGIDPGDYDIVTDASPQQVMKLFKRTIPVGVQFGVILVIMKGKKYEVAQFRNMTDNENRLRDDALHRDFTINGMFYDPFSDKLIDYVEGQRDIQQKIIRGIENPQARFEEDKLRMMRAVRFAISYDYCIEPITLETIKQLAPRIQEVSVERIRDELLKILTAPHPDQGIRLLDETGLLEQILPEVSALKGVQQPPEFHSEGDVYTHTLLMLEHMSSSEGKNKRKVTSELAMGVLLHDVGKPETYTYTDRIRFHNHARVGAQIAEQICSGLKFSTKATEKIVTLVKNHQKFFDVEQMKKSTLKRFLRQEYFRDLLELHRLDCLSSNNDLRTYEFCQKKLKEFRQKSMRPPHLISGKDLIRLGFTPGPVFKQVLEFIEDAQLEGTVSTKKEAINLVKEIQETLEDDFATKTRRHEEKNV